MKLSELKQGESAVIKSFDSMPLDTRKKLMVMGVLPKTPVTLIRRAPLGDPLQVDVRGVSLALRHNIAAQITVEISE
ncbi:MULTISPECIES: FeoA family protein [Vibrio]|uniref:Iron transporter FeoA n=2 Tax=Vibrio genomosp. F10 TaxID=723171 RepID=A0A1B9QZ34_9VIBR|nr:MULTISPECIES: FeoA family protein [Vibrio]OCH76265.1 iron transporter FeoA [Vibrio genomosp. F10]OEE31976.1 iron transporter FeoA [Vibrio genomosp. F10 str. ZF-129]OEE96011.1 iron transporter FeoA [Vibrio genomosp. F10 str. 9ZC157]OEF01222.1 iron transporter FeoA [Vibrio genomosp. F10 str. 9ZD137]OEF04758.1 iron transporter FeoA [Vibrio genomosp. F10 str. 9ZB36]